jgi:hypothetical protein
MMQRDLDLKSPEPRRLLIQTRTLIEEAHRPTFVAVNIGLTLLYWSIGTRIQLELMGSERATYGEQIVVTLSRQFVVDYGRSYSEKPGFNNYRPNELEYLITLARDLPSSKAASRPQFSKSATISMK